MIFLRGADDIAESSPIATPVRQHDQAAAQSAWRSDSIARSQLAIRFEFAMVGDV